MLNQLIYTRCYPHRDIKKKGEVERREGLGVFSASQGMMDYSPAPVLSLLLNRAAVVNGADEDQPTGRFGSYDFFSLGNGDKVLSFDYARNFCEESRNGQAGNRKGTHIKQMLIGNIEQYPYLWFGADAWDAYKTPENDYYLNDRSNAEPPILPSVSDTPSGGYITIDRIRSFVRDGREEAVKAGVWFLLQEYSKPESERKVLLIKDIPENVELWVASLELAFSPRLAAAVSFSTNTTNLSNMGNASYFYYTDRNGAFSSRIDTRVSLDRHPYAMIVGYHPQDSKCMTVRQMPASEFRIIDGTTKKAQFTPDQSINSSYYNDLVRYDDEIGDFTRIVLPAIPLTDISDKIPELYDAYQYILNQDHKVEKWTYEEAVNALASLLQFGMLRKDSLKSYIITETVRGYKRFAEKDQEKGFGLLKQMWKIGLSAGMSRDVSGCAVNMISESMWNLKAKGNALTGTWRTIRDAGVKEIVRPALKELFNDAELDFYSNQFENAPAGAVRTVMEMYFGMLDEEAGGVKTIADSNQKYAFVCRSLIALAGETDDLQELLKILSKNQVLLGGVALTVSKNLEQSRPGLVDSWWDNVIDACGGNVLELIRTLTRSGAASTDMVEHMLANGIKRSGKCQEEYIRAMLDTMKSLGKENNTGLVFYKTWIDQGGSREANSIIRSIRAAGLEKDTNVKLFRELDRVLSSNAPSMGLNMVMSSMKEWEKDLGVISESVALYELERTLESVNDRKLIMALDSFGKKNIQMPKKFLTSNLFSKLLDQAAKIAKGELNMEILCMFDLQDAREQKMFAEAFVGGLFSKVKRTKLLYAMISVSEAIELQNQIFIDRQDKADCMAGKLKEALKKTLPEYYKFGMEEKIMELGDRDRVAKNSLCLLMQKVRETSDNQEKGIKGFLKNFFK